MVKNKPLKVKKTVIFTGYNCNNQCLFCIDEGKRHLPDRGTAEIKQEMVAAISRGSTYLELIGGEVTLRSDLAGLIAYARKLGFKTIHLTTNGRMFAYPEYAKKIIEAGLTDIVFSIHGHNKELHDKLTNTPGSFDQIMLGIKNVKQFKALRLGTNTTIVKQNYQQLAEIGKYIFDLGIRNAEFIFVDPNYGGAKNNFFELVPRISDIAPYVKKCLEIGRKNDVPHWHIRYVPLCYFSDFLGQISELDEVQKFKTEHIAPDFSNYAVEESRAIVGRVKKASCRNCKLDDQCEGIWVEYVKNYGDQELKPII